MSSIVENKPRFRRSDGGLVAGTNQFVGLLAAVSNWFAVEHGFANGAITEIGGEICWRGIRLAESRTGGDFVPALYFDPVFVDAVSAGLVSADVLMQIREVFESAACRSELTEFAENLTATAENVDFS